MVIPVDLGKNSYDITIEKGALSKAGEIFEVDRKVLIVTDDGVPEKYAEAAAAGYGQAVTAVIKAGEASKTPENLLTSNTKLKSFTLVALILISFSSLITFPL